MLAGVRGTFQNILFTVVAYKARPLAVTLIAGEEHRHKQVCLILTVNKMMCIIISRLFGASLKRNMEIEQRCVILSIHLFNCTSRNVQFLKLDGFEY